MHRRTFLKLALARPGAEVVAGVLERAAWTDRWRTLFTVSRDPLVSRDIVGDPHAASADLSLTTVVDVERAAMRMRATA